MEKHALSSVFGRENEKKNEKKTVCAKLATKGIERISLYSNIEPQKKPIGMLWKYRLRHVFVAKALKK